MIAAALAAASILGTHPLSIDDPARQALVVQSLGRAVLRLDAAGLVQARACDGRMRHVGLLLGQPVTIHIESDGALTGLSWNADVTPEQRVVFREMVRAWGLSDRRSLAELCLPTTLSGAGAIQTIMDGANDAALADGPF
ncbi:MAG: hypothetical protein JWP49_248 [Phenylobacterium sp.]|nr:hypothetical protein [Phenylobacterium sp.]